MASADELARLASGIRRNGADDYAIHRITELAVAWVLANPMPVANVRDPSV